MKKQPQITEQTKKNIVEAFWTIYKEKDISQITVTETIKKAGYNRATFYNYFYNVQSILDYIEDKILESFKKLAVKQPLFVDFNQTLLNDLLKIYEIYGEYFTVLLSENGDPLFSVKIKNMIKPIYYAKLNEKYPNDFKTDIILEYTTSALISAFLLWSKNKDSMKSDYFFEFIDYLMNNGTKKTFENYF